jgi:hypothetical protein
MQKVSKVKRMKQRTIIAIGNSQCSGTTFQLVLLAVFGYSWSE